MGISMGVLIFSLPGFCLLLFHGDGTLVFRKRFSIERTGQPDYARQRPIVIGTLPALVLFPPFFGDVFLDLLHAVAAALIPSCNQRARNHKLGWRGPPCARPPRYQLKRWRSERRCGNSVGPVPSIVVSSVSGYGPPSVCRRRRSLRFWAGR